MSLTEAQRELLIKNNVPKAIRQLIERWLARENDEIKLAQENNEDKKEEISDKENISAKSTETSEKTDKKNSSVQSQKRHLDFLLLLSDLLMVSEKHLDIKRRELNAKVGSTTGFVAPSDTPPEILSLEDTIKEAWHTATSLWRVADEVVRDPEPYDLKITREHARYMILTKNLTVLEMIRTSYLDYFDWPEHIMVRQLGWLGGGVFGAFSGLVGGLIGGLKAGFEEHGVSKLIFPVDAIMSMVIGWANGVVLGAKLGYRTASIYQGARLAFLSAYLNPFRAPKGSKQRQAVELKIEETVFNLSEKWERKNKIPLNIYK